MKEVFGVRRKGSGSKASGATVGGEFLPPLLLLDEVTTMVLEPPDKTTGPSSRKPQPELKAEEHDKNVTEPIRLDLEKLRETAEVTEETVAEISIGNAAQGETGWTAAATVFAMGVGGELLLDEKQTAQDALTSLQAELQAFSFAIAKYQQINYSDWARIKVTSPSSHLVGFVRANLFSFIRAGMYSPNPPEPYGGVTPVMKALCLELAKQLQETGLVLQWVYPV